MLIRLHDMKLTHNNICPWVMYGFHVALLTVALSEQMAVPCSQTIP